jgi:hypothetical protein
MDTPKSPWRVALPAIVGFFIALAAVMFLSVWPGA